MNDFYLTIGENRYVTQLAESCARRSITLFREYVSEVGPSLMPLITVSEGDHVWEALVTQSERLVQFEDLLGYLRSYAIHFDTRYRSPLRLSRKAAYSFARKEHKRPVRLKPTLADYYPGSSEHFDSSAVFQRIQSNVARA